jgi:tetratricopeptide (TPR) repeat protein
MTGDRLQQLQKLLEREPSDAFLLYGIAMEHKKLNDSARALEFLERTIQVDPGYSYAWYQKGLIYESMGQLDAARAAYRDGIAAAQKKGDAHAQGEIEAALSMIQ